MKQVLQLFKDNSLLLSFYTDFSFSSRLDFCALTDSDYLFCHSCFNAIEWKCSLKYSALNSVNVSFCQYYSCALCDLTLTEKCLIARSHLIVFILKLCSNDVHNSVIYNQLHDHVVVLPQDSGSLLDILLSAEIKFHEKIKMIWFDDRSSTADDLKSYLKIWKQVVYQMLQWLWLHNKLYSWIVVNQDLLNLWVNSFILSDLEERLIHCENDHKKHDKYVADIEVDNCKNDLHKTLDNQTSDLISTDCVYSDVKSKQQHPELQKVLTILNLDRKQFEEHEEHSPADFSDEDHASWYVKNISVIWYVFNSHSVLMNDWQDSEYFIRFFSILFLSDSDDHLLNSQKWTVFMSLKTWAK